MNDKDTTGVAGRRPPTEFQEKRAAFFGHNDSVCRPDLVREAQRAKGRYSPERAQRLGGNGHVASAATRNVSFSSGAEGGLGGGSAGALTGSTSPPPDSGARASSTPLVLFDAGPDAGGSAWGGHHLLQKQRQRGGTRCPVGIDRRHSEPGGGSTPGGYADLRWERRRRQLQDGGGPGDIILVLSCPFLLFLSYLFFSFLFRFSAFLSFLSFPLASFLFFVSFS